MNSKMILIILVFLISNPILLVSQKEGPELIDSLMSELKKSKEDTNKVNVLNLLSFSYLYKNPDSSQIFANRALDLSNRLKWSAGIANSLAYIGVSYWLKSDNPKSLEYLFKALKISEEIEDKKGIGKNLGYIGMVYYNQIDYPKALDYYTKSLKIFMELKDILGMAKSYNNIGLIYLNQSENTKALDYFKKSLEYFQKLGDDNGIANNLGNIGYIYFYQSNYPKALDYSFQALDIFRNHDNIRGTLISLGSLSDIYKKLSEDSILNKFRGKSKYIASTSEGNLQLEMKYLLEAVELSKTIGDLRSLSLGYSQLYESYKSINDYYKALEYHELYTTVKDSMFNIEKTRKIASIESKREMQLKQKEIEVLNKEKENQRLITYFFIILSIIGFIFTLMILYFYRRKKQDNALLAEKNTQIENANIELEKLNEDLINHGNYLEEANQTIEAHRSELEKYSHGLEDLVKERTIDLENAITEVQKANKLKTEIIANMNHEIRTPLNFIKGSAALIKMSIEENCSDPELIDFIGSLDEGVNRLTRTLELFSELSSLKSGNYKPNFSFFDLKIILESMSNKYIKKIKQLQKPVELQLNLVIEDVHIQADEHNIEKTFDFILDNAIKFTDNGIVKIELKKNQSNKYLVSIEDTGIGIAEDYKNNLFKPFFQEDMSSTRKYEGIGLSLALAYEYSIVNKFDIRYESEKGKGTKFYLEFNRIEVSNQ